MKYLILLFLFLSACSKTVNQPQPPPVNPPEASENFFSITNSSSIPQWLPLPQILEYPSQVFIYSSELDRYPLLYLFSHHDCSIVPVPEQPLDLAGCGPVNQVFVQGESTLLFKVIQ